jgi:DNA polymerase
MSSGSAATRGNVRIGLSGWTCKSWRRRFYPKGLPHKQELAHIASVFSTVEINGTFYSMQSPDSFGRWGEATPDDFVLAVKGPRFLTHMTGRRDPMSAAVATLKAVAKEAASCTLCPLYRNATQTVFGEGLARASIMIMMVGEQPGDQEDLAGHPVVGPAGKIIDRAMAEAGLDRRRVYLVNAVKHFKNEPRGKKRLHKKPNRYEVEVCRVWPRQEIELVRPQLILAMGVTAAVALAGRSVVLSEERSKVIELADGQRGMVTVHPSSILRMPEQEARHASVAALVADLKAARKQVQKLAAAA